MSEIIVNRTIESDMKESYLDYAMSVIIGRAIPDVRDGLKPVHRRILYSMWQTGLHSSARFKKCATVVGEVLGKYHPHGDSAVYDSLVRMAQDFSLRYVLVHGQGNFGSIDGDNPAAYRYTESKLKPIADEMLVDLDKETVEMIPNFDGSVDEPVVLPSKLPMVLLNGSSGIAVGMATNIPPHNLGELSDALIHLIDGADEEKLLQTVTGPDFPTGGIIVGRSGILSAYKNGRGSLKVRARAQKDEKRNAIIVTEIPYQVTKTSIIDSIVEAVKNKKIEGISGVHDRSDKDGMEIVIDIKKGHDMDVVLNQLYAHTGLQSSFGIINLAIVGKQPKVMGLKEMLSEFLTFRKEIIRNRCNFELKKATERAHILEGLRIALSHIDPIVNFLKASKDLTEARSGLMSKYSLSEIQANAILEMRLSRLVALEREKIESEHNELIKQISHLKEILADDHKILHIIKEEIIQIKQKYADPRRTDIVESDQDEKDLESLIPNDEVVVVISARGYVKRVGLEEYRTQNRGGKGVIGNTKEEDFVNDVVVTKNHNYLLLFTDQGRMFWLKVYQIPESSRYATGKTLVSMLDLKNEKVTSWISVNEFTNTEFLSMVTKNGIIKRTSLDSYSNVRKGGIIAINLRDGDSLVEVIKTNGNEELLIATKNGQAIRFKEDDAREVGRNSIGVIGIRFKENEAGQMDDEVIGMTTCKKPAILTITENGYGKRTAIEEYRLQGRGGSGIINIIVEGRNGPVVGVKSVEETDEIIVMSSKGQAIRTSVKDIRVIGRNTQGVRIIRLADGETVATFAVVAKSNQETDSNMEIASN